VEGDFYYSEPIQRHTKVCPFGWSGWPGKIATFIEEILSNGMEVSEAMKEGAEGSRLAHLLLFTKNVTAWCKTSLVSYSSIAIGKKTRLHIN
jgi:hypothetical protein